MQPPKAYMPHEHGSQLITQSRHEGQGRQWEERLPHREPEASLYQPDWQADDRKGNPPNWDSGENHSSRQYEAERSGPRQHPGSYGQQSSARSQAYQPRPGYQPVTSQTPSNWEGEEHPQLRPQSHSHRPRAIPVERPYSRVPSHAHPGSQGSLQIFSVYSYVYHLCALRLVLGQLHSILTLSGSFRKEQLIEADTVFK